jgi:hypothetical protein
MITDEWFMKDINAAVKKIAAVSTSPVYYYEFSFDGPFGIIKRLLGAENLPGKFLPWHNIQHCSKRNSRPTLE